MFTGGVGRIRLDVDVATAGAMAKIAALKTAIENIDIDGRGQIGDLFAKSKKSFQQFAKESDNVYDAVNGLITKSYFLQAAISGLVPVVAQLVGGLFALGSQAAAAAPALIVLPGIMTAMMQAAITAKLALGGVFKAVGELGKAKTTSIDQMPRKLRAFENAQYRVERAQKALTRAYREAAERIEQLGFDTEDAALAQERAALALEDARATLARVQDLPPNSRARQEAELAFREADLNYRRAIDTSEDLVAEQNRVSQNGKLTGDEQVDQSEEVLEAQRNLRESMRDLVEAQKELNKAQSGGAGLTEFNKLSKAAQEFARYLVGLKPEIQKLKDAAGEELFGPLQAAIQNLVDKFFPRLIPLLRETGKALGKTALDFSKIATEASNLKNFETIGKTNIDTIGKLGTVVGNLYSAFLSLLAAADPLIRRFTNWVVTLTGGWKATSEANNQSGKLANTFKYAGDVASQLGDIIGNLFGALMNMGKAAAGPGSGGEMILDALEKWSEKWKNLTKMMLEDGSLSDYFRQSSEGFMKVAGIIGKIVKIILKSATQEGTGEFLDSLSRTVDTLGVGFNKLAGSAPSFGRFIEGFARLTVAFTESGSIKAFFNVLTKAVNITAAVFENEFVAKLFGVLAAMHGAKLAFLVLRKVAIMLSQYLLGMIRNVIAPLKYVFGLLTKTIGMTALQAAGLMAAVAAVVAVLVLAWKNSKKFRDALKELGEKVLGSLSKAFQDIKEKFEEAFSGIFGKGVSLKKVFESIGDALAKYVVPVFAYILPKAIEAASLVIQGIIDVLAGAVRIIVGVFKIIQSVFKLFTGDFDGFLKLMGDGLKAVFGGLVQAIIGFFSSLFSPFKLAFAPITDFIAKVAEKIVGFLTPVVAPLTSAFSSLFDVITSGASIAFGALEPVLNVLGKIAKIIGTVLYVAALVTFTLIGLAIAGIWRSIKGIGVAIWQNLIYPIANALQPSFEKVLGFVLALTKPIRLVFDGIILIIKVFIGIFILAFDGLRRLWRDIMESGILGTAAKVFSAVRDFFSRWVVTPIKNGIGAIKDLFGEAFDFIGAVASKVFEYIQKAFGAAFGFIKWYYTTVWSAVWGGIKWAWENVIKPVFGMIKDAFALYWNGIKTVFNTVWPVIWGAIKWAWENVIKPVFNAMQSVFGVVWGQIKMFFDPVWGYITRMIVFLWDSVISPVFNAMQAVFGVVWSGIKVVFDAVWPTISGAISWSWENVIKPVFGKIGTVFSKVWDGVKTAFSNVWDNIKLAFTDFPQFIKNIFNNVIGVFNKLLRGIIDAFKQIPTLLGKVWSGVVGIFKGGVNFIIKGFNKVLGGKSFTLPGWLGGGTFGFDKIPELGSGDKFDFEQIVTGGYRDIPGLALGGTVFPRSGGTLVRIAEAGRPERVEPLDPDGLSNRDKAMIKLLSGGAGGVTINVHPSPGMDEVELAALVNRQLAFELRKGAA